MTITREQAFAGGRTRDKIRQFLMENSEKAYTTEELAKQFHMDKLDLSAILIHMAGGSLNMTDNDNKVYWWSIARQ